MVEKSQQFSRTSERDKSKSSMQIDQVNQVNQVSQALPKDANIFVQRSTNENERPMVTMESLNEINQKVLFPSVPPCISIQINRYN